MTSSGNEVLVAVRAYMEHFFGCAECSKNFQKEAENVETEVRNGKESVLWLWATHNRVNLRLHGDQSEDPVHQKRYFPPYILCRACYKNLAMDDGHPSWILDQVLYFLVRFYGRDAIKVSDALKAEDGWEGADSQAGAQVLGAAAPAGRGGDVGGAGGKELDWWETKQKGEDLKQIREIKSRVKGQHIAAAEADIQKRGLEGDHPLYQRLGKVENPSSSWGVTHIDLSLCMVFYVASTVIIFFLYHHFIMRRSNAPCKSIRGPSHY